MGADGVRQQLGYDGAGIGVAVIDSGVTAGTTISPTRMRPAPSASISSWTSSTATRDRTTTTGHGTHVAGIIAGNGADSNGARTGIAPGARLVVLKVLDEDGRGRISDVIAAIDYAVAHKSEFNIRVLNLSIGAGVYESYNTDLLTLAAKRAVEAGIVVVAAAGNHGRNSDGVDAARGDLGAGECAVGDHRRRLEPHGHDQPRRRHHRGLQLARSDRLRSRRQARSRGAGRGHLLAQQSRQHDVRDGTQYLLPGSRARRTCRISV